MHYILKHLYARIHGSLDYIHCVCKARVEIRRYRIRARIARLRQTTGVEAHCIHIHEWYFILMDHAERTFGESAIQYGQIEIAIQELFSFSILQHGIAGLRMSLKLVLEKLAQVEKKKKNFKLFV